MRHYTEDDAEIHILSDLLRYFDHNRDADRSFVDSVYDFFEKTGFITEGQLSAITGIYGQLYVEDFINDLYQKNSE